MDTKSPRWRWTLDSIVCAALLVAGLRITTAPDAPGSGPETALDVLVMPAVVLPILLRHRHPFAAAVAFAAGCVVGAAPTFDQLLIPLVILPAALIAYALARDCGRARASIGLTLVLTGLTSLSVTDPAVRNEAGLVGVLVFAIPLYGGIWLGGRLVRSRHRLAEELAERCRVLERQRERTARLAVEVERTELASELDTAARDRVRALIALADLGEREPERARELFPAIERMGRESLNEMRELLGALRSDGRAPRSPRPTLAQLETLLADARRGGRLIDLHIDGERRPLPEGVELAAYRVLQHALVAVRGADGRPARIGLRYLPDALELEVSGPSADWAGAEAALLAARERIVLEGGSFSADSASAGRRVLRARIPAVTANV